MPRLDATLSATFDVHTADNCIDDDTSTFCHTPESDSPWLSVHLVVPSTVSQVIIYNRLDCCREKLVPFQLWAGMTAGDYNSNTLALGVDEVIEFDSELESERAAARLILTGS